MLVPGKREARGLGSERTGEPYALPWEVRMETWEGEAVAPAPGDWLLEGREPILLSTRPEG